MKTRILLIGLLLLGTYKAMACGKVTIVEVNQPYGRISCKAGSGYELNHEIAWLINIGKNKKVRIKYYKDTPDGKDPLSFYSAPDAASLRACINNPNYFITNAASGFTRGTVTTDTASGCCVVLFQINNGGNSNYPGLEFEFSAAPDDNTVETNSSSKITGSQYVMEKLGIGTDAPVVPLHLRENQPLGRNDKSYVHLSRYQGRTMGVAGGDSVLLVDDYFYNNSGLNYRKGMSVNNPGATPETLESWIEHNPQHRQIRMGSDTLTLFEARVLSYGLTDDTASKGEISIGENIFSQKTGEGVRLSFLGAHQNTPLYIYRNNPAANKADLRVHIGTSTTANNRFVVGHTTSGNWVSHLAVTADGKVGVGVENPQYPLHVNGAVKAGNLEVENALDIVEGGSIVNVAKAPSVRIYKQNNLPTQKDSTRCLVTFSGSGNGNIIKNSLWLRRDAGGSGWEMARLHDGVSVDVSFLKPGKDTKTWWERDPKDTIQSWGNENATYMTLKGGRLGIGVENPQYTLDVKGAIRSTEVKIESVDKFPDYVFSNDYDLRELESLKAFIKSNGHLPEMPSAEEVKDNGMGLVDMQLRLLKKIEELTLYILMQDEKISTQNEQLQRMERVLKNLTE